MTTEDNSGLKMLASFFGGIIITGIGAWIGYPHDLPTKTDMEKIQSETEAQLSEMQKQNNLEQDEITSLRINVAKIAEKLRIQDGP